MVRNYIGRSLPHIVTDSTGFLLSWVAADATRRFEAAMGDVGITPHQLGVMSMLRGGPQKQARISEQLEVFKPVMVTIVNELEAAGYVERRPHPTDRRAVEVHLLPAGAAKLDVADELLATTSTEMFEPLADSERAQLHALLLRLATVPQHGTVAPHGTAPESKDPR